MRVRNKEIRQRQHRKEQKIKEALKALREQYGDKKDAKATPAPKPAAAKKAPAKKKAEAAE